MSKSMNGYLAGYLAGRMEKEALSDSLISRYFANVRNRAYKSHEYMDGDFLEHLTSRVKYALSQSNFPWLKGEITRAALGGLAPAGADIAPVVATIHAANKNNPQNSESLIKSLLDLNRANPRDIERTLAHYDAQKLLFRLTRDANVIEGETWPASNVRSYFFPHLKKIRQFARENVGTAADRQNKLNSAIKSLISSHINDKPLD